MNNTLYRRSESDWIGSTGDRRDAGTNYWRAQARKVFPQFPQVEVVEIVHSGRKTDSAILKRGSDSVPCYCAVIVASTGGAWGKSRRNFMPV